MTGTRSPSFTPTVTQRASLYLRWRGQEIPRGTGFLQGTRILCPSGHVMNSDAVILGDGAIYCNHRTGKGHAECGALIYLLTIPARGDERKRFWLADCTREELREIQQLGLDANGVLAYFGASFTR